MVDVKIKYPKDFLDEEIRCGYTVSAKMKEIWLVELDLLAEFDRVCKQHNMKYWASGGTLLGAVRHKGYIPWDDDIDVVMLRDDFEEFCKFAPAEFEEPYFWQTHETDANSYRGHAQLRNSSTTGILRSELHMKIEMNQGIFIDIFPIDKIPCEKTEQQQFFDELRRLRTDLSKYDKYRYPFKFYFRKNLVRLSYDIARHYIARWTKGEAYYKKKCDEVNQRYADHILKYKDITDYEYILSPFYYGKMVLKPNEVKDIQRVPFEFIDIPVPAGYDALLTRQYGYWHEFVNGGSYHGGVFFDTEKSYKEYMKENAK